MKAMRPARTPSPESSLKAMSVTMESLEQQDQVERSAIMASPEQQQQQNEEEGMASPEQPFLEDNDHVVVIHVYCKVCKMWLNGLQQWSEHTEGKKHQKALRRRERGHEIEPAAFSFCTEAYEELLEMATS